MSKDGLSFQQTKTTAFVESIALERNLWTNRSVMSVGIGGAASWTEYLNPSERAVHRFMTPAHVHSTPLPTSMVVGVPGSLNHDVIGGTGWVRIFVRVWGVAHKIPTFDIVGTEGEMNIQPIGSLLYLRAGGTGLYAPDTTSVTINVIHPGESLPQPSVQPIIQSGFVGLNVFEDVEEVSDQTFAMNRIIGFSAQLPVDYAPALPWPSWNQIGLLTGDSAIYNGGSQPAGEAAFTTFQALGTRTASRPVCKNALNTTDVLTGEPFFADPTNTVQLLIQRVGFRQEPGPRPVTYFDLL